MVRGTKEEIRALSAHLKLVRAAETVGRWLARRLEADGLTMGQLGVLEALHHLGPMHQRELGRKLLRSDANVTAVIDNLERDGLVERVREDEDRRKVTIRLTADGKRRIAKVFPAHAKRITEAMRALTVSEQKELGRLCKKLGMSLEE
jgi:MarR family transcriptional regulator, 2-MHQ and catechol-resistance regulon repressor